jgi:hypothetical protein
VTDDLEFRIARLELEAGDILVVKTDRKHNHDVMRSLVPGGVRVLYIPSDVELSVLTKAEIESRATGEPDYSNPNYDE